MDEKLSPQNRWEEYGLRENQTFQSSDFGRFAAIPDLKPVFLEKEAARIEVNQWAERFMHYINMGYRNFPPQKGVWCTFDKLQLLKVIKRGNEKHLDLLYTLECGRIRNDDIRWDDHPHLCWNRQHDVQTGVRDPSRTTIISIWIKKQSNGN